MRLPSGPGTQQGLLRHPTAQTLRAQQDEAGGGQCCAIVDEWLVLFPTRGQEGDKHSLGRQPDMCFPSLLPGPALQTADCNSKTVHLEFLFHPDFLRAPPQAGFFLNSLD